MKSIEHYVLLLCICSLLSACSSNAGKAKEESTIDTCSISNQEPKEKIVPLKPVERNAVLYLDCSVSMKGYINTTTDATFNNVISSLLYWMPTTAHLFDTKEQTGISRNDFIDKINTRKISWSDESDLAKMIASMIKKVNEENIGISYLITDGIMSGSNQEIKNSPARSFNIKNRGTLTERIADAVSTCKEDIAILLIKYTSNFTGEYYCYTNEKVYLKESKRPFYVVAVGNRGLVKELMERTQKEPLLSNSQGVLLLGDEYPYDMHLTANHREGITYSKDGEIAIGKMFKADDFVFFNGNLSKFPEYMRSSNYFEKNAEVYIQYLQKGEFKKLDSQYISYEVNGENIEIGVQAKCIRRNALYLKLKYELPDWIESSSIDDDKNIMLPIPKTFNFKYFVEGLNNINSEEFINKIDTLKFK